MPTTRLSSSSQNWKPVSTSKSLKDTLEQRVNAFFQQPTHRTRHKNAYDTWIKHTKARKPQWDLRTLLDVVKQIPLSSVKFVSNSAAYKDRVHFLYPFEVNMESSKPKTPPASPANTEVSANKSISTSSPSSPELLASEKSDFQTESSEFTTMPNTPVTNPVTPNIVSSPPQTNNTQVSETQDDEDIFDDTERGVTGRFIANQVQRMFDEHFEEQFQEHSQTIFNNMFHDHFQQNMNLYSDNLDSRIRHIVSEDLDNLFEHKIKSQIKTSVKDMYDTIDSATMESIIDDKIGDQVRTHIEQSATTVINTEAQRLSKTVLDTIIQPKIRRILEDMKSQLDRGTTEKIEEIKNAPMPLLQSLRNLKADCEKMLVSATNDINEARDSSLLHISSEANTQLDYIAQEAADALKNFSDIAAERTISLKRSIYTELEQAKDTLAQSCRDHLVNMKTWFDMNSSAFHSSHQSPTIPTYSSNQRVWYTKDRNSVSAPVTIVAVHSDADGAPYYTVKFPTGLEKQTTEDCLSQSNIVNNNNVAKRWINSGVDTNLQTEVQTVSTSNRTNIRPVQSSSGATRSQHRHNSRNNPVMVGFDDDDDVQHAHSRPSRNTANSPGDHDIKTNGPTSYMVNQFHKYFKGKVESHNTLLTFYQQLRSQGPSYGILLQDLKNIRPDVDLCPPDVSHVAREAMKIALYQRLQDVDCVHMDYVDAQNHIESYSTTSDGYSALYQMLRMVHPYLMEGGKLYNAPKLSEAENLFQYAAMCRNYLLFQEIQNRNYTEKEQSEMFLQNVDDPEYMAGRAQCLTELGVATMDGSPNVKISNMRFANLPTTLQQYTNKLNLHSTTPTIRAIQSPRYNNKSRPNPSSGPRRSNYEPFQCIGCGLWGHKVTKCKTVPKMAIAMEYIKSKPRHVEKLTEEFLRINNKSTKTSSVRVLQTNGMFDTFDNPDTYLNTNDIDVPMEEVPFTDE